MIMPDLSPFEQKYSEWAETMHIEKSKFSVGVLKLQFRVILLRNGRLYHCPHTDIYEVDMGICAVHMCPISFSVFLMRVIATRLSVQYGTINYYNKSW